MIVYFLVFLECNRFRFDIDPFAKTEIQGCFRGMNVFKVSDILQGPAEISLKYQSHMSGKFRLQSPEKINLGVGTRRIFHVDPDKGVIRPGFLKDLPDIPITYLFIEQEPEWSGFQRIIPIDLFCLETVDDLQVRFPVLICLFQVFDKFTQKVYGDLYTLRVKFFWYPDASSIVSPAIYLLEKTHTSFFGM